MDMEQMVKVSVVSGRVGYRPGKGQQTVWYDPGIREMPLLHAMGLGLAHRIVEELPPLMESVPVAAEDLPFDGRFSERLAQQLTAAKLYTLEDVAAADTDFLRSLRLGPAAYEQINQVLHDVSDAE